MNPNDVQTAITNSLVQGGSQWLIATIVAFLPVLWTMACFTAAFTSSSNVTVALVLMWISLAGVALVAAWLFVRALMSANRSMGRRLKKEKTEVVIGATGGGE